MELSTASPEYKMVFVVNMQLDMGRGKQCAQVAHAAVSLSVEILTSRNDDTSLKFQTWLIEGQKKIVLKGDNLEQITRLADQAEAAGLPNHLVTDAGYTQIAPGSKTVLAIFGASRDVDNITDAMPLNTSKIGIGGDDNNKGCVRDSVEASMVSDSLFVSAYEDQIQLVEQLFFDRNLKHTDEIDRSKNAKKKKSKLRQPTNINHNTKSPQEKRNSDKGTDDFSSKQCHDKYRLTHQSRIYRLKDTLVDNEFDAAANSISRARPDMIPPVKKMDECPDLSKIDEDKLRREMLVSWYNAGYNAGYYDAMKKLRQICDNK